MQQVVVVGGEIRVVDVPPPALRPGAVRVRTAFSLVSAGTESAGLAGGGGLLGKAMRNPDLVRKVLQRVSSHGLGSTASLVRDRLNQEMPTGYSCAGTVTAVGEGVTRFREGDRVACAGAGYANHAAVNVVPVNLVAPVPPGVGFEDAAFATLGAIALHGVRRAAVSLGDRVAVLGLGLLGQLTCQMLRAAGCVVVGCDVRRDRVDRASSLGLRDGFAVTERELVPGVLERTGGRGADAVIVTAAAPDAGLLNRACEATRRKGRVVVVGDVPLRVFRDRIYAKEIDLLIATSYGPGRYDPDYEERGHDYPFGYVRWTEGRNLEEVLRLIDVGSLAVRPLVDVSVPVADAVEAYRRLSEEPRPIGVLLGYPEAETETKVSPTLYLPRRAPGPTVEKGIGVGVIGYGAYLRSVLLPILRREAGFRLRAVCARTGTSVRHAVEHDGFERGTTDHRELLADPEVDLVLVATRHDLHYPLASAALAAGKGVFVEKPMTRLAEEGRKLVAQVEETGKLLTVGFNRRFSPHVTRLRELLLPIAGPKTLSYRVNAGPLPKDHWLLDPEEGGGRLLGEGVHFFDLLAFLAGSEPVHVEAAAPRGNERDEAVVCLAFADGSVANLVYSGAGSTDLGKERLEVLAGGASFVLDDFRRLHVHGLSVKGLSTRTVEKGQPQQIANVLAAFSGQADLGVTAADGLRATWCAEQALASIARRGA